MIEEAPVTTFDHNRERENLERAKAGLCTLEEQEAREAADFDTRIVAASSEPVEFRPSPWDTGRDEPVYDPHDGLPGRPLGAGHMLAKERAYTGVYEGVRIPEWGSYPVPRERGEACWPPFFDPKARPEKERPVIERTRYTARPVSFNQIMELWAAHEVGRLMRVLHVPGKDDEAIGEDEARLAWEWVARTPGWNPIVHEVMRHLEVRKKGWSEWPKVPQIVNDNAGCDFCPWPFITLEVAGEHWRPFCRRLRHRYRRDPFIVRTQTVEYV